jgi:hypothetical protein
MKIKIVLILIVMMIFLLNFIIKEKYYDGKVSSELIQKHELAI